MPETRDIRCLRLYVHTMRYPLNRLAERASTNECEEPYRRGRGVLIRLWPTHWALVIGRWERAGSQETAGLFQAVGGRMLATELEEIKQWPGGAPDEVPEELADSTGVVTLEVSP